MRVFYVDEEESKTRYYVKLDNVNLPDELKKYTAFDVANTEELLMMIREYYGLKQREGVSLELWSGERHTSQRLDTMDKIPKENEFINARLVINNRGN